MFFKNLLIIYRWFINNPLLSFISVFWLTTGITTFLFISLYIYEEIHFDSFHSKSDRIIRVCTKFSSDGYISEYPYTMSPVGPFLLKYLPETESMTRLYKLPPNSIVRSEKDVFYLDNILYADSFFFDVFDFKILDSNPGAKLLGDVNTCVISKTIAQQLFGNTSPIGKKLYCDVKNTLTITGIIEDPPFNSHIPYDIIISFKTLETNYEPGGPIKNFGWNPIGMSYYTYLVIKGGTPQEEYLEKAHAKLKKYLRIYSSRYNSDIELFFQPLKEIHLKSRLNNELKANGNMSNIRLLKLIGLFIILISIINVVLVSLAKILSRYKESAVRKTVGATRFNTIMRFIGESIAIAGISTSIALVIIEQLLPMYNLFTGHNINTIYYTTTMVLPVLVVFIVGIGFISGIYPGYYISSLAPVKLLRKQSPTYRRKFPELKKIFVLIQFLFSILLLSVSFVLFQQITHLQTMMYGFNHENVIVSEIHNLDIRQRIDEFRTPLQGIDGIEAVTTCSHLPGINIGSHFFHTNLRGKQIKDVHCTFIGKDFFHVLKFNEITGNVNDLGANKVIVNSAFIENESIHEPIGFKIADSYKISGVINNFIHSSFYAQSKPHFFIRANQGHKRYLLIRLKERLVDNPSALSEIENIWANFYSSEYSFKYETYSRLLSRLYKSEFIIGRFVLIFAFISFIISCLSLLGLVYFNTGRQTKQIGVKKALGASVYSIYGYLLRDYIFILLLAIILSIPLSILIMESWLSNFAYRISITPLTFLFSGGISMALTLISIGYIVYKRAKANPVESLRYE